MSTKMLFLECCQGCLVDPSVCFGPSSLQSLLWHSPICVSPGDPYHCVGCIYRVEMFLLPDGGIFLNEVAPRPHNSGHYTQNGCVSSQFENHVRAVLGWPLGDTSLNCGCCIMLNLLGEADGDEGVKLAHDKMAAAYHTPGASVHWCVIILTRRV